ncbi:WhiB family transcriptional regulator [Actinomadura litoris]|uniref:WhiB family transcriptional regulator n=1 Tax=Actinomadura litoris TaxID=2678616 RepID=UPI0023430339|nr:WhiB family transcriptional regulator [Actinomadura litoris]
MFLLNSDDEPPPCADDPDLWFVDDGTLKGARVTDHVNELIHLAKDGCAVCPYKTPCLQHALENGEYGIWGGTTTDERRRERRRMARRAA